MRLLKTETFFEDTDPQSRFHNTAFPSLLRCPGSLLLCHRVGRSKNSADGTLRFWRSENEGASWLDLGCPFPATPSGLPGEFRPSGLSLLDNGRIGILLTWIDHPDDVTPLLNPETEGLLPIHIGWAESDDNGAIWGAIGKIEVAPAVQPAGNGSLVVTADGAWLAAFETYKPFDDPTPWSADSLCVRSIDQGASWSRPIIVAKDDGLDRCYWDHHITCLRNGTLLGALWMDDRRRPGISEVKLTLSTDNGLTWELLEHDEIRGQHSKITELRDGRLLLTYVRREGEPSIRMRLGTAEGWEPEDALVLYSHTQHDLARSGDGSFGDYLGDMSTWSFGWPSVLQLGDDDSLLAMYYVGHDDFSALRMARVAL